MFVRVLVLAYSGCPGRMAFKRLLFRSSCAYAFISNKTNKLFVIVVQAVIVVQVDLIGR